MLDFPTAWLPKNTILILILPVTVLTELFCILDEYDDLKYYIRFLI